MPFGTTVDEDGSQWGLRSPGQGDRGRVPRDDGVSVPRWSRGVGSLSGLPHPSPGGECFFRDVTHPCPTRLGAIGTSTLCGPTRPQSHVSSPGRGPCGRPSGTWGVDDPRATFGPPAGPLRSPPPPESGVTEKGGPELGTCICQI